MTDWAAIEADYVSGTASYDVLAKKYGICVTAVKEAGAKWGWVAKRAHWRRIVAQKATEKAANRAAGKLAALMISADKAAASLDRALSDGEQLYTYLVERSEKYKRPIEQDGKLITERKWTEERRMSKADTKALRDLVAALKDLTAVTRDLYETPGYLAMARERRADAKLELEKGKSESADSTVEVIWGEEPEE